MKKSLLLTTFAALVAFSAFAAKPARTKDSASSGRKETVRIVQEPRLGMQTCLLAPSISGPTLVGQCYKKPRRWIVLETKYETYGTEKSRFIDQLTFTWHVLLDTKSATENKGNDEGLAPYSYFTTATTYANIPAGAHAASVVLPPSYLERYGSPKAIGLEITNKEGDMLAGGCWSEIKGIESRKKFWENAEIMGASQANGKPMIERRQGLIDRSKSIWALVFPNDYEATVQ
ncbi:MAG: hypothetical protein J6R63_00640 [Kiritimatiellae bacterium]|jgi:hypothetical protein|nr:hypothetical protein [Kiritimatiellia bacterium]